jgi:hypothetical protein
VTLPDSVAAIRAGAFSRCTSLSSISIPDSVTFIGTGAFGICPCPITSYVAGAVLCNYIVGACFATETPTAAPTETPTSKPTAIPTTARPTATPTVAALSPTPSISSTANSDGSGTGTMIIAGVLVLVLVLIVAVVPALWWRSTAVAALRAAGVHQNPEFGANVPANPVYDGSMGVEGEYDVLAETHAPPIGQALQLNEEGYVAVDDSTESAVYDEMPTMPTIARAPQLNEEGYVALDETSRGVVGI